MLLFFRLTYENTCITEAKHLIIVNAEYGSCSGTSGTPQFQDIIVNGALTTKSVSGAYSTLAGYNSSKTLRFARLDSGI